jgi:hypothetical protein
MRKNITALLAKGNLTPKERYLLLIQNDIIKATTGKEPLTEADKKALESWKAKTNEEAREWNKFNEGWKLSGRLGIEAEMIYWQTRAEHFRKFFVNMHLTFYPFYRDARKLIESLEKIAVVDINEALKITNQQREQKLKDGIDFDYAVYQLAFESLSKELQDDLKLLYDEVEYDTEYLDSEEIIAGLIQDKEKRILGKENKEKLAELVASRAYNSFAKEYQLYHYFGNIPILEVAKRFLDNKGIDTEKITDDAPEKYREILENYARDNKTTIKDILKETLIDWLELGLPYTPLVISEDKNTYNGDTKNPHNFIYAEWIKSKEKARETLQKLIDKGELKVRERTADETRRDSIISDKVDTRGDIDNNIFSLANIERRAKKIAKIITGESLYNFKGDYKFIKNFKERVDNYDAGLGIVYDENDPEQKGQNKDRELLIATKNNKGELNPFSLFGLTIKRLKRSFEATQIIKETEKDGEIILDFDNDTLKEIFKEIKESLISGYTKLLAFRDIQKRLSKTYEIDLNYLLNDRVDGVGKFIDDHNDAIKTATGEKDDDAISHFLFLSNKKKQNFKMQDDLLIDKSKLLPDIETLELWSKKFEDILGDDF